MFGMAFFLLMPLLIHHAFSRFNPHTLIAAASRNEALQMARQGRWQRLCLRLHRDHHEDRFPDAWKAAKQHPPDLFLTTAMPMAWALLLANDFNLAGHLGHGATLQVPGLVTPNGRALRRDPHRQ